MLWRLNHELLPDPGRPIASTTVPLLARAGAAAGAGTAGVGNEAARGVSAIVVSAIVVSAGDCSATTDLGTDTSAIDPSGTDTSAVGIAAAAGTCGGRGRDPPRPPRLRRRRDARGFGSAVAEVSAEAIVGSGASAGSGSRFDGRRASTTGTAAGASTTGAACAAVGAVGSSS